MPQADDFRRVDPRCAVVAQHDLRPSTGESVAESRFHAAPPRMAVATNLRKLRRQLVRHFAGGVGRAVVDDQQFEIVRQIRQEIEHPTDVGMQRCLGIMNGQQDAERAIQGAVLRNDDRDGSRPLRKPESEGKPQSAAAAIPAHSHHRAGRRTGCNEPPKFRFETTIRFAPIVPSGATTRGLAAPGAAGRSQSKRVRPPRRQERQGAGPRAGCGEGMLRREKGRESILPAKRSGVRTDIMAKSTPLLATPAGRYAGFRTGAWGPIAMPLRRRRPERAPSVIMNVRGLRIAAAQRLSSR